MKNYKDYWEKQNYLDPKLKGKSKDYNVYLN